MIKLKVGDKAPIFNSRDHNGNPISLSDFKWKKLILYFYPKDDTPGCTKESCNFRDHYDELKTKGFEIAGVSTDDEASHQKFIRKFNLPFPLIADTEKQIVRDYGVWGEKNMYGRKYMGIHRTTFVIDENGSIEAVIQKVKPAESVEQILEVLAK